MAEITGIAPQVKDKTRCNIEIDGRFYCGLTLEAVMRNRLKAGMQVTEEELARIQLESEKETALDRALTHISTSMKTERELREYLSKRGYLPEICDYVVGKMKSYGYLDDGQYAKAYVSSAGKRKGRRLLAAELRRKGIADEEIDGALETLSGERETAAALLEKYLRGKETDRKTLRKAYAYLLGKGFDHETVQAALLIYGGEDAD